MRPAIEQPSVYGELARPPEAAVGELLRVPVIAAAQHPVT
jgi:hypothetical protein